MSNLLFLLLLWLHCIDDHVFSLKLMMLMMMDFFLFRRAAHWNWINGCVCVDRMVKIYSVRQYSKTQPKAIAQCTQKTLTSTESISFYRNRINKI